MATQIGVISDTHGLMRPEALRALQGVSRILHAGDIGDPAVLEALRGIAPVTAVRGNNDFGPWAREVPLSQTIEIEAALLHMVHDIAELDLDPAVAQVHAVICGHSHRPQVEIRDGILFLNPGSAGPRRFRLPIAVARMTVDGHRVSAETVELDV